jgi:hypothetical protein
MKTKTKYGFGLVLACLALSAQAERIAVPDFRELDFCSVERERSYELFDQAVLEEHRLIQDKRHGPGSRPDKTQDLWRQQKEASRKFRACWGSGPPKEMIDEWMSKYGLVPTS